MKGDKNMKKIITLVPLFTLLVACNITGSKKEVDLFETKEKFLAYNNGVQETLDIYNKSKVINFEATMKNTTVDVKLNAKSKVTEENKVEDSIKVNAAIKNLGFKASGAVSGYTVGDGKETAIKDLKGFTKFEKFSTTVSLDYKLPDSLYKKEDKESTSINVKEYKQPSIKLITSILEQKGKVTSSIKGANVSAYLDNGVVYADLSNEKLYSFVDKFLNSGLIKLFPKQKEKYSSIDLIQKMIPGYEGKVAYDLKDTDFSTLEFDGLSSFVTPSDVADQFALEKAYNESKEGLSYVNAKSYEYSKDSKYSFAIEITIDKNALNYIIPSLFEDVVGSDFDVDAYCEGLGIAIKKLDNKFELKFAKDNSIEFSAKLNNVIKVDLNKLIASKLGLATLKGSLTLKGEFNAKVFTSEKMEETFPKFDKYLPISFVD